MKDRKFRVPQESEIILERDRNLALKHCHSGLPTELLLVYTLSLSLSLYRENQFVYLNTEQTWQGIYISHNSHTNTKGFAAGPKKTQSDHIFNSQSPVGCFTTEDKLLLHTPNIQRIYIFNRQLYRQRCKI